MEDHGGLSTDRNLSTRPCLSTLIIKTLLPSFALLMRGGESLVSFMECISWTHFDLLFLFHTTLVWNKLARVGSEEYHQAQTETRTIMR